MSDCQNCGHSENGHRSNGCIGWVDFHGGQIPCVCTTFVPDRAVRLSGDALARRELWRELAEKRIEQGVDWPNIVLTLFRDYDQLAEACASRERAAAEAHDHDTCGECAHQRTQARIEAVNEERAEVLARHRERPYE